jgi:glycosyltransferase involved in cell wall biosynthesis
MKILLVAFACHPEWGSESSVGWKMACQLGQRHQVHVLTHLENRGGVEKSDLDAQTKKNLSFSFVGKTFRNHPNRWIARLQSWWEYLRWLRVASREVPHLCQNHAFDLIHHLTLTTWRIPPIQTPCGMPLIWGPLGGTARYPWNRILGFMSPSSALLEGIRNILNSVLPRNPILRKGCRRASVILGVNQESSRWLKKLAGRQTTIVQLSAAFFSSPQIREFKALSDSRRQENPLRAFAGGSLIGSKGVGFALRALRIAKDRGVIIPYTVASYGPEKAFLEKMAKGLGLQDQVAFHPGYTGSAYRQALRDHSIYLLPSFREGSAITILEAMLSGQVPVVVKASTQGEIVTSHCGFAAEGKSAEDLVQRLADALVFLATHPLEKEALGRAAHERVASHYHEQGFVEKLDRAYATAVGQRSISA